MSILTCGDHLLQLMRQGAQAFERGNLNDALSWFEEALELCWDINSSEDDLADCLYKMANTLHKLDKPKKAELFYNLAESLRVLGLDNFKTFTSFDNFADMYYVEGRIADAVMLYEKVFKGRLRLLGADHPDTVRSYDKLIKTYSIVGRDVKVGSLDYSKLDDDCDSGKGDN